MKILQVCKKFPFPVKDGEAIAMMSLSRALRQLGCSIHLLSMNTQKHFFEGVDYPPQLQHYTSIDKVSVDTEVKWKDALFNLFSPKSYHIARFESTRFQEALLRLLKKEAFNVVQLETLYLAPYIPLIRQHSKAIVAMRAHNIEHEIWDRISQNEASLWRKMYLRYLTKKLRAFEIKQLNSYDLLIPITRRDEQKFKTFGFKSNSIVVPIGIDRAAYPSDGRSYQKYPSLSFIGSLDWMPNQEGLRWFLDQVWGKLLLRFPALSLHIAGRNTPDWVYKIDQPNIKVYGEIPDAIQFINDHSIMVVPLLSGSGMRAKILEGMALGKVVLTTSLGLEGIDAENKKEVLIADTVDEFVQCIDYCFSSNGQLKTIGENARRFVRTHYDHLKLARRLVDAYSALLPTG